MCDTLGIEAGPGAPATSAICVRYRRLCPTVERMRRSLVTTVARLGAGSATGLGLFAIRFDDELIAIAVAVTGQPPRTWLSIDDPDATSELETIVNASTDSTTMCLRVLAQLERRRITNRYFPEVKRCVALISAAWSGPSSSDHERRHRLSLQLVCRLMFVRFVEQKGWLNNDLNFLAKLVLEPGADRLFATRLRPLFFDALNRPVSERDSGPLFAAVPFLNGGLFAPSHDELEVEGLDVADTVICEVFERLFVRWRFVSSSVDSGVDAIGPEMLGAIFERLMDADERSATGTWYTPSALVTPMVESAISQALDRRLRVPLKASLASGENAAEALKLVSEIRVLDPAAGSGAFLLGALETLAKYRVTLSAGAGKAETLAHAKRFVVSHNLYGVDISATAIGLAELRLWLALAASMPDGPGTHIEPLPNLGHHLRHGDALISPWQAAWSRGVAVAPELALKLREVGWALASASGSTKYRLEQQMRATEAAIADDLSRRAISAIERRRAELKSPGHDLLGQVRPLSAAERRELAGAELALSELRTQHTHQTNAGHGSAFDIRLHFADAMEAGGFDVVLGNPPWVRLADLPAERRALLRAHYRWVAEAGGGRAFGAQADLAVAFVERAAQLTRHGGVVHLLIPSKLFTAGFGGAMRHDLLVRHELIEVADEIGDAKHFAADVYPARLFFRKGETGSGLVSVQSGPITLDLCRSGELPVEPGDLRGAWAIRGRAERTLLQQIRDAAPPLSEVFSLRLGVKTGANDVFVDPPDGVGPCVAAVGGREIGAFGVLGSRRLLFGYDLRTGALLETLDVRSARYLGEHERLLAARRDADPRLAAWQLFRVRAEALGHRVVWRDLSRRLEACALKPVLDGGPVALNTAYTLAASDRAQALRIAAWLNTDAARLVAQTGADAALGGYRRFFASNVGRIPMPSVVQTGEGRFGAALNRLASTLHDNADCADSLGALGELSCELLGISQRDVKEALLR
jgi:hypothetical protein